MYQLNILQQLLEENGLHAGVNFLNRRVPHRYTGIFELVDGFFHVRDVIDKLRQPFPEVFKVLPFDHTFCPVTLAENGCGTHASMNEPNLAGREYQNVLSSYVGLPLLRTTDHLFGTLCHFDFESHRISDEEFDYLKRAVAVLSQYLPDATSEALTKNLSFHSTP